MRIVLYYVLRDSTLYFTYCFETYFEIFLGVCVRMIIFYDRTYFIGFYIYELSACRSSILKMVSNVLLSAVIKCLSKLIIELFIIKNK